MLSLHHSPSLCPPTLPSVLHPFFFSHPIFSWRAGAPLHPPLSLSIPLCPSSPSSSCQGAAMALMLTCCQFNGRKNREKMPSGGNNTAPGQIFKPPRSVSSSFPRQGVRYPFVIGAWLWQLSDRRTWWTSSASSGCPNCQGESAIFRPNTDFREADKSDK